MNNFVDVIKKTTKGKVAIGLAAFGILVFFICISDFGTAIAMLLLFLIPAVILFLIGLKQVTDPNFEQIKAQKAEVAANSFKVSKSVGNYVQVDDVHKRFKIPCTGGTEYNFSDLLDFEVSQDGNSITKGGAGQAAVGGLLFGGVGAIVGGVTAKKTITSTCSRLQINIRVNDLKKPSKVITMIKSEVKKDSSEYKKAIKTTEEIVATLQYIVSNAK